jgi:hypothetical protein
MNVKLAPDPCEALNNRAEVGLRVVASMFDNITHIFLEEHAMREVTPRLAQGDGIGPRTVGRNIMEETAETRRQLTAACPRLEADAEMGKLTRHIADKLLYDYWQQQYKEVDKISLNSSRAIYTFREEALDAYKDIRTELEKKDTSDLLHLSNSIRLKLRVLEPFLAYHHRSFTYREVPTREGVEARSTKMDNAPEAR